MADAYGDTKDRPPCLTDGYFRGTVYALKSGLASYSPRASVDPLCIQLNSLCLAEPRREQTEQVFIVENGIKLNLERSAGFGRDRERKALFQALKQTKGFIMHVPTATNISLLPPHHYAWLTHFHNEHHLDSTMVNILHPIFL